MNIIRISNIGKFQLGNSRKNILFLSKWYPNKDNLFHGIFVHRHAICAQRNHNVHVIFAKSTAQKEWITLENSIEDEIHVLRFYYKKDITGIKLIDQLIKLYLYLKCFSKGLKWFENNNVKFDIIHGHILGRSGYLARKWSRKLKIPYVITEHWSRYFPERNEYKGLIKKSIDGKVINDARFVLTVSQALATAMQNHGLTGNYKVVRNVVVNQFFQSDAIESGKQFLIIADQDNRVKNISGVINTFKKLANSYTDWQMVIIGDGADLAENIKLAEGFNIIFLGEQPAEEVKKQMNRSAALILFSNFENAPCVIGESEACGLPVIVTKVGGVSELVPDRTGMIINPGDTEALNQCMIQIMEKIFEYNSETALKFATENFSEETISNQLNLIYQSI